MNIFLFSLRRIGFNYLKNEILKDKKIELKHKFCKKKELYKKSFSQSSNLLQHKKTLSHLKKTKNKNKHYYNFIFAKTFISKEKWLCFCQTIVYWVMI